MKKLPLFCLLVFISLTIELIAEVEIKYWKPQDFTEDDRVDSIMIDKEKAFLLATNKKNLGKQVVNLYILDIKDALSPKVLGKFTWSGTSNYFNHPCKMEYFQEHLYIVPAGSYQTEIFVFDVADVSHVKMVTKLPLFMKQAPIHYVEFPLSVTIESNRLFVQLTRGFSIWDLATPSQPKILHELDNMTFLAAKGNKVLSVQGGSSNIHALDLTKNMQLPPSFDLMNKKNNGWTLDYLRQSDKHVLFTTKVRGEKAPQLQLLDLDFKVLSTSGFPTLALKVVSWEWASDLRAGCLTDKHMLIQTGNSLDIYSLSTDNKEKPKHLANIKKDPYLSDFSLQGDFAFFCSSNLGLGIAKGW